MSNTLPNYILITPISAPPQDQPTRNSDPDATPLTHVLIATDATQGQRKNDFCWTERGELVTFPSECDGEEIDGRCGCRRSMTGVRSLKATTTVEVAYLPGGIEALKEELHTFMQRSGWSMFLEETALREVIQKDAEELIRIASAFPLGAVLEIRGDEFRQRFP